MYSNTGILRNDLATLFTIFNMFGLNFKSYSSLNFESRFLERNT